MLRRTPSILGKNPRPTTRPPSTVRRDEEETTEVPRPAKAARRSIGEEEGGGGGGGVVECRKCVEWEAQMSSLTTRLAVMQTREAECSRLLREQALKITVLEAKLSIADSKKNSLVKSSNARKPRGSTVAYSMGSRSGDVMKLEKFLEFLDSVIIHKGGDGNFYKPPAAAQQLFRDAWRKLFPETSMVFALSVSDDYDIVRRLNLRWSQRRALAQMLRSRGIDVFAGWNSVFEMHKSSVQEMASFYELEMVALNEPTQTNTTPSEVEFVRVRSVKDRIEHELNVFDVECMRLMTLDQFNGEVWLGAAVDQGGDHTKMICSIMNTHCSNSPMFTMMLGCLAGSECHANLELCFRPLFRECEELSEICYRGTLFPVRWFFVADFKLLNTAYGLSTCASKYPCVLCKWRSGQDFTQVVDSRDFTSLGNDLSSYQSLVASATNDKQREDARERSYSVVAECLVGIDVSQICMPFVHFALGMGIRLVVRLEAAAITADVRDLHCPLTAETFDSRSDVLDQKRAEMDHDNLMLLDEEREKSDIEVLTAHLAASPRLQPSHPCASPYCVSIHRSQIRWGGAWKLLTCTEESPIHGKCSARTHSICTFLCMSDGDADKEASTHVCDGCRREALATLVKRVEKRAKLIDTELNRLRLKKAADDMLLISLENVINCNGPRFRALRAQMSRFGAIRAKFFQPYNGRQIRKLFESSSIDALFQSFGSSRSEHAELSAAMADFQYVMRFATKRFLTDAQILDLKVAVDRFRVAYERVDPNCFKQIKFHSFCVHLCEFAEKWHMLGLWTEQALEHLHHMLKVYLSRFENIGDRGKRVLRAIVEREVDVHRHHLQATEDAARRLAEMEQEEDTAQAEERDINEDEGSGSGESNSSLLSSME